MSKAMIQLIFWVLMPCGGVVGCHRFGGLATGHHNPEDHD